MQNKIDSIDFVTFDEMMPPSVSKRYFFYEKDKIPHDSAYKSSLFCRYCIPISIGNSNLPNVLLDTGSSFCVFNTDTMNYQDSGETVSTTNIYGESIDFRKIFLKNIRLSNTEFIPDKEIICGSGFKYNLLGGDFLKHFVWYFDNVKRKIYFSRDSTVFPYDNCIAVPFHLQGNRPFIKCIVDGMGYDVLLDTGCSDFLHIAGKPNLEADTFIQPRDTFYSTYILNEKNFLGNYMKSQKPVNLNITISDIEIASLYFNNELVKYNNYDSNILGWDFFQRFNFVVFDYLNQRLYLGPESKFKHINYMSDLRMYVNTIGAAINPVEPYTINTIMDRNLLDKGLSLGDTVTAIDGKPVKDIKLPIWLYLAKSATITTKKGNAFKKYSLARKNYIEEPDTVMSYGEITDIPIYNNYSIYRPNSGGRIITYYDWIKPY